MVIKDEFENCWGSDKFELYTTENTDRLRLAVKESKMTHRKRIKPFRESEEEVSKAFKGRPYQKQVLNSLRDEREYGSHRSLFIAPTGVGKTVIAALDYRRFSEENPERNRLLFIFHRKEISSQSLFVFKRVRATTISGNCVTRTKAALKI